MELGINLGVLAALGLAWTALAPSDTQADFPTNDSRRLATLERALGERPDDIAQLQELSRAYLLAEQPGAALALLRDAQPSVLENPALGRALAQSYEGLGRFDDALSSAQLTLDRCARALGASDGPSGTAVPRFRCSARQYAQLSIHHSALRRIVAWGVVRLSDRRIAQAYNLALRRARVASAN